LVKLIFTLTTETAKEFEPKYRSYETDKIIDEDIPGLAEFEKFIAFVDENTGEIITCSNMTEEFDSKYFGHFETGLLEIPSHGKLAVYCLVKE